MTVDRPGPQHAAITPRRGPGGWSRRTKVITACVAADLAITAGVLWWLLS
jgi:hypothetical protein